LPKQVLSRAASHQACLGIALVVLALFLAACANDKSLYERHRGKFPEDYRAKVKAAIEKGWPEPRKFRVVSITEPAEGYIAPENYWDPQTFRDYGKYGVWLGCVYIRSIPGRGADFADMDIPYVIARYGTAVKLVDEPSCRHAPYEPWLDMKDGIEASLHEPGDQKGG
jgi:hypothetical protein